MDFLTLAKERYSVRSYTDKKVEKEKLDKILEAAKAAPTAVNYQPFKLLVVESDEGFKKLSKGAATFGAPLAIVVLADHASAWMRDNDCKTSTDIDSSIVTDHMMMEATDLGLGSVWVCNMNVPVIKSEFKIPQRFEPVNVLYIGYAASGADKNKAVQKRRKEISELVCFEAFE